MKDCYFSISWLALGLGMLGLVGEAIATPVLPVQPQTTLAQINPVAENHLAQRINRERCRAAKETAFIYSAPTTRSPIYTLQAREEVEIAENEVARGPWIAVNSPRRGFVETRILVFCTATSSPNNTPFPSSNSPFPQGTNTKYCINNRVDSNRGLEIYADHNRNASIIDRVFANEEITLSGEQYFDERTGHWWFNISHPIKDGWIEYGIPNTGNVNLTPCEVQPEG